MRVGRKLGRIAAAGVVVAGVVAAASAWSWSLLVRDGPPLQGEMRKFSLQPTPRALPEIAFSTLAGEPAAMPQFRGKLVLLNLWATWCAPCVQEMPSLERLQALLGGEGLAIVALSSDRGGAQVVEPFLANLGLKKLPIYLDPKGTATRALGARGLPTTLILDRDGRELGRLEGAAQWDGPGALALLRHYLAPPKRERDEEAIVKTSG
jgi:thiol-disulfide isomerase/thioredoxin